MGMYYKLLNVLKKEKKAGSLARWFLSVVYQVFCFNFFFYGFYAILIFLWCLSFSVVSFYELSNLDAILFSVCKNESCIYIEHCESSCNHLAFKRKST